MHEPARPFATLSRIGQLRRIGQVARQALTQYGIESAAVRLHHTATNLLYRVRTLDGQRLMLRMAAPGWRKLENLQAEAAWLDALARDTDIGAPRIVWALDDTAVVTLKSPTLPAVWHATLMTWVDGRLLAHYLSENNLVKLGDLFARLHLHGKAWQPPPNFSPMRFDQFLSRGEPDRLFAGGSLHEASPLDCDTFRRMRDRVEREYARLNRADLRVIHCDLWHENVKLHHGRLHPFDFEDTIWGFRLHDIAMAMLDLLEDVGAERYVDLLAAFRHGYEHQLDWPEGNLAVLQIGRLLWKANYVARFVPDALNEMVVGYGRVFRQFEETGQLVLSE